MNRISTLLVFLSMAFSLQTQAQVSDSEISMKVQSRVGKTYLGTLSNGRMAAIVCTKGFLSGAWSADLVYSVRQNDDKVPELTLESYRTRKLANTGERRSNFVELTSEAAAQFCANPSPEYVFKVAAGTAVVSRTVESSTLEASAGN